MSDFIAGMPKNTNNEKNLASSLVENSAKNALFDFFRMSACLSHELGILLPQFKMRMAVAESCTSGLLGSSLTQINGSSNWFEGGVISYSNSIKQNILNVEEKILKQFGAVSMPTACEMASGVCSALKTHFGISITGIAGPSGGSRQKPVGTVFIGVSVPKAFQTVKKKITLQKQAPLQNGMEDSWLKSCQIMKHIYLQQESNIVPLGFFQTKARHFLFEGDRESIRQSATLMALYFAYETLLTEE